MLYVCTVKPHHTMNTYQPKTGQPCACKRGQERDNCPQCEGTGMRIDFAAIRARNTQDAATFTKVRFTGKQGSTAGLVLSTDKAKRTTIGDLSRLFPMGEARKMERLELSPAFETWVEAFAFTFPFSLPDQLNDGPTVRQLTDKFNAAL